MGIERGAVRRAVLVLAAMAIFFAIASAVRPNFPNDGGFPGFGFPGDDFPPGFPGGAGGWGGGWGGGYGGPGGAHSAGGTWRPSVVCKERGRCYKKKLTCPAKCFTSYSHSGKNSGGGGGGGGCTFDCKKCVASC